MNVTSNALFIHFIVTEITALQIALEGGLLCLLKCNTVACITWDMCNVHNKDIIHTYIHTYIHTHKCICIRYVLHIILFSCNKTVPSNWTERVRNEVLHRVKEERNIL
jgi:hypothetical protein